jgi:hypothetical protein
MMSADCCMPRHREWCTMEAVGRRRPPWFIGGGFCVLPSFNLGKACSDVADPKSNQLPTTYPPNYLHENWWMRMFQVAIPRSCLLGSHLCHGVIFLIILVLAGLGEAADAMVYNFV